jgi:signal transduction histidine kinase
MRVRRSYTFAILASLTALIATLLADDPLIEPNTLLLFLAAVMCSSWYGGIGPGIVSTVLTGFAALYFYMAPAFSFTVTEQTTVRVVEFGIVGLLISVLNEGRRRSQARAEQASTEAAAANRIKDEFLATVSHELRTPLAAILGWTQILRTRGADPSVAGRALDIIERSARTESRLVEDLLDVSRTLTSRLRLHRHPLQLIPVLQAAIDTVQPAIEAKTLTLRTQLHAPCLVLGDPERVQQILWNVLSNAVKFTPNRGSIEIVADRAGTHARIAISDSGSGIDPTDLPHIFEPFRQGAADRERYGGLGLGLAIARHLTELHGGTLRAESAGPGQGSRFVLELPALTEASPVVAVAR